MTLFLQNFILPKPATQNESMQKNKNRSQITKVLQIFFKTHLDVAPRDGQ